MIRLGGLLPLLLLGSLFGLRAQSFLDINRASSDGSASVTSSALDLGTLQEIFDDNAGTLARSRNVNPLVITIQFRTEVPITGIRAFVSAAPHGLTVETAQSLGDLDGRVGSFQTVVNGQNLASQTWTNVAVNRMARLWRFSVRRLAGDNFVHVNEIELSTSLQPTSLSVVSPQTELYPTWSCALTARANGVVPLRVRGVQWRTLDAAVATVRPDGTLTALSPGTARAEARYSQTTAEFSLAVRRPVQAPEIETITGPLAQAPAGALYEVPVLLIRYLPTVDGVNIDTSYDSDYWNAGEISVEAMRRRIDGFNRDVKFALEEGSRFRGYRDANAVPSLGYRLVAQITVYEPTPPGRAFDHRYFLDYAGLFARFGVRRYVEELGVKEVWVWHGNVDPSFPAFDARKHPAGRYRQAWESEMAGPNGRVCNCGAPSGLPEYGSTYTVYNYNVRRSQAEAIHNHGHQLESILSFVNARDADPELFWQKFSGANAVGPRPRGRAGDTHFPPNATRDYEYESTRVVLSDIEDWHPDGGARKAIGVDAWRQLNYAYPSGTPPQRTETNWYIYWMQAMPGARNGIAYRGQQLSNWWQHTARWDESVAAGLGLMEGVGPVRISFGGQRVPHMGRRFPLEVTASGDKGWIATTNDMWIRLSRTAGRGNGLLTVEVLPNEGAERRGSLVIGGERVEVWQEGAPRQFSEQPNVPHAVTATNAWTGEPGMMRGGQANVRWGGALALAPEVWIDARKARVLALDGLTGARVEVPETATPGRVRVQVVQGERVVAAGDAWVIDPVPVILTQGNGLALARRSGDGAAITVARPIEKGQSVWVAAAGVEAAAARLRWGNVAIPITASVAKWPVEPGVTELQFVVPVGAPDGLVDLVLEVDSSGGTRSSAPARLPVGTMACAPLSSEGLVLSGREQKATIELSGTGECAIESALTGQWMSARRTGAGVEVEVESNRDGIERRGEIRVGGLAIPIAQRAWEDTLTDVAVKNPYFDSLHAMAARGIVERCGETTLCPDGMLTRRDAVVWLGRVIRAREGGGEGEGAEYGDVERDSELGRAIGAVEKRIGRVGCTSDQFCPDTSISRAEYLRWVVQSFYRAEEIAARIGERGAYFVDVERGSAAFGVVQWGASSGLELACSPGRFCPDDAATRQTGALYLRWLGVPFDVDPMGLSGATNSHSLISERGGRMTFQKIDGEGEGRWIVNLARPGQPGLRYQIDGRGGLESVVSEDGIEMRLNRATGDLALIYANPASGLVPFQLSLNLGAGTGAKVAGAAKAAARSGPRNTGTLAGVVRVAARSCGNTLPIPAQRVMVRASQPPNSPLLYLSEEIEALRDPLDPTRYEYRLTVGASRELNEFCSEAGSITGAFCEAGGDNVAAIGLACPALGVLLGVTVGPVAPVVLAGIPSFVTACSTVAVAAAGLCETKLDTFVEFFCQAAANTLADRYVSGALLLPSVTWNGKQYYPQTLGPSATRWFRGDALPTLEVDIPVRPFVSVMDTPTLVRPTTGVPQRGLVRLRGGDLMGSNLEFRPGMMPAGFQWIGGSFVSENGAELTRMYELAGVGPSGDFGLELRSPCTVSSPELRLRIRSTASQVRIEGPAQIEVGQMSSYRLVALDAGGNAVSLNPVLLQWSVTDAAAFQVVSERAGTVMVRAIAEARATAFLEVRSTEFVGTARIAIGTLPACNEQMVRIVVPATAGSGVSTGRSVQAGQTVRFLATGTWANFIPSARFPAFGPDGGDPSRPNAEERPDTIRPDIPFGVLLGKIGQNFFRIGSAPTVTMPAAGTLELIMNDRRCCFGDNWGALTVQVTPLCRRP